MNYDRELPFEGEPSPRCQQSGAYRYEAIVVRGRDLDELLGGRQFAAKPYLRHAAR